MIRNPRSPCGERRRTDASLRSPSNFNPRSPCGERREVSTVFPELAEFQSTLPVWGATTFSDIKPPLQVDFNPRSPCGERPGQIPDASERRIISIHAPRVGSDGVTGGWYAVCCISIHAPRVGSDLGVLHVQKTGLISIHAPRVGSDRAVGESDGTLGEFQSTLPVWGATGDATRGQSKYLDFNPRSPCGERLPVVRQFFGDNSKFQSTLPVWGATCTSGSTIGSLGDFNPRSPCGERLSIAKLDVTPVLISIHAPRVGSDETPIPAQVEAMISIHAPRVGSDAPGSRAPDAAR